MDFEDYAEILKNRGIITSEHHVLDIVEQGLAECTKCIFLLEHIRVPISENTLSFSSRELKLILSTPAFLDKTTFMLDEIVIDKNVVIRLVEKESGYLDKLIWTG